MPAWRFEPSQLPVERDRLTRWQETIFYYLVWHQFHARPVPAIDAIAASFGCYRLTVFNAIHRLEDLGLARVSIKSTRVFIRAAWCKTLEPA